MSDQELFGGSGLSPETIQRFNQLAVRDGNYTILAGLPCLLAHTARYDEKVRLLKALTRVKTMLLRLHVTPQSDVSALAGYWGKACWNTDVKAILDSLNRVQGGAYLDIVELLPPLPTSLLYTYPIPDNPLNGAPVRRDCHWSSLNFFRDPPENRLDQDAYMVDTIRRDYFPVTEPRFGDVLVLTNPAGQGIHSAVYIADDVYYTKNGPGSIDPWQLATHAQLIGQYSFGLGPNEQLTLHYFRGKYL
jgi:hypothetical protein